LPFSALASDSIRPSREIGHRFQSTQEWTKTRAKLTRAPTRGQRKNPQGHLRILRAAKGVPDLESVPDFAVVAGSL